MMRELTITVDDTVYNVLKPMVEQQTIGSFLHEFMQSRAKGLTVPSITEMRGSLHQINTSDIREEADRSI